jgi:restriction endonuclease
MARVKATVKGRLVERIAAWLHSASNVRVERNFRCRGKSGRYREVDVFLTTGIVGYPVSIAIECKNEAKPIGVGAIDAFIGKLDDLAIPPQMGIFISASGYTKTAICRARVAGIRALVLQGLNPSGLDTVVAEAFESVIYVLASLGDISVISNIPEVAIPYELVVFRDEAGNIKSSIPQLLWERWMAGVPASILGTHELDLSIPESLKSVVGGQEAKIQRITVTVDVAGLVMTLEGHAKRVSLIHAETGTVEKVGVRSFFQSKTQAYPLVVLKTEADLNEYFRSKQGLHLIRPRIRVPRIVFRSIYWPPSVDALERLRTLLKERGNRGAEAPPSLVEVEGTDLEAAWGLSGCIKLKSETF